MYSHEVSGDQPSPAASGRSKPDGSGLYKWYVLLILFLIFICSYIDRSIMSILQLPIQKELGLSDLQLGMLNGLAFTLCYALAAIPLARLADRGSRKTLIAIILTLWSVSTALCGWATGFVSLFILRVGVAFGEGGCAPMSVALISDYFPRERRATAIALWTLSVPLGSMLGYAVGGWLDETVGWRNSFLYVGSIGIFLLPLWLLTVKEPVRGGLDNRAPMPQPKLLKALTFLWNIKTLRFQIVGASMQLGILYVFLAWNVPFFVRSHDLSIREAALYTALAVGMGGAIGSFSAGAITDRLSRLNPKWYVLLPAISIALVVPVGLLELFSTSLWVAVACAFLVNMLAQTYLAPVMALGQSLVPAEMRAFTSAVQALIVVVLAGAPSPVVVGLLSDLGSGTFGAQSLKFAMATALCLSPVGLFFYLWASKSINKDWDNAKRTN